MSISGAAPGDKRKRQTTGPETPEKKAKVETKK